MILQPPVSQGKSLRARLTRLNRDFFPDGFDVSPASLLYADLARLILSRFEQGPTTGHWVDLDTGPSILGRRLLDYLLTHHPEAYAHAHLHLISTSPTFQTLLPALGLFDAHETHVSFSEPDAPPDGVYFSDLADDFVSIRIAVVDGELFEVLVSTALNPNALVIDTQTLPPQLVSADTILAQLDQMDTWHPAFAHRVMSHLQETESYISFQDSHLAEDEKQLILAFVQAQGIQKGRFNFQVGLPSFFDGLISQFSPETWVVFAPPSADIDRFGYLNFVGRHILGDRFRVITAETYEEIAQREGYAHLKGLTELAIQEARYEEAIGIANQLTPAYRRLGVSMINLIGSAYFQLGDSLRAQYCFEAVQSVCPDYWRSYINLGTLFIAKRDYEGAFSAFARGFMLSPPVLWETLLTLSLLCIQHHKIDITQGILDWILQTYKIYPGVIPQAIQEKAQMFWNHYIMASDAA